jgi:hypothetical protein
MFDGDHILSPYNYNYYDIITDYFKIIIITMAQEKITIAKSVYHTGDSWYHFYVEFEITIKSNGLSSIFGITTDYLRNFGTSSNS